jgi:hypothetical protein
MGNINKKATADFGRGFFVVLSPALSAADDFLRRV